MCKTIIQKARFHAQASDIYQILTDSATRTRVSGKKARISQKIGGEFHSDGGFVEGVVVDYKRGERFIQAWRNRRFPRGVFSMASFYLQPTPTGTEMRLIHRGVPKDLIPQVEKSWRALIRQIKAHLQKAKAP